MKTKLRLAALALALLSSGLFAEEDASRWNLLEGVELDTEASPPKAFVRGKEVPVCDAAMHFLDATLARSEAYADVEGIPEAHIARTLADRWESIEILSALCLQRKPYAWRLTPQMRAMLRSLRES